MEVRRIVTGRDADGKSIVVSDGPAPRTHDFASIPGFSNIVVWATEPGDTIAQQPTDITETLASIVPAPGGTRCLVARFPPDSVFTSADFDPEAAAQEQLAALPGLAETFEPDAPGFHTTPTVDCVVVLEGEVWLELDGGHETLVRQGDMVVQNGTRHAWHNRTERPVTIAGLMVGLPTS
jgi:mannose-6-phosphate isomerase-like protein (cupin superfamily)